MQRLIKGCIAGFVLSLFTIAAWAQAPASTQSTPKVLTMPPNYQKVIDGEFAIICEPNDVEWVKKATAEAIRQLNETVKGADGKDVKKWAKVEGGPEDMLERVKVERGGWVKQIADTLSIDPKLAGNFFDEKVIPHLEKAQKLKPVIYHLVTTGDKLNEIAKTGWGDPKLRWLPVAGKAQFDESLTLSLEGPMSEQFMIALYDDKDKNMDDRVKGLANALLMRRNGVLREIAGLSIRSLFPIVLNWVEDTAVTPLGIITVKRDARDEKFFTKEKRDQVWFHYGLTNYLAAKYTLLITKVNFLEPLVTDPQEFPFNLVPARQVNLINPVDPAGMRQDIAPIYELAMRRRATIVVAEIIGNSGDTTIAELLKTVKEKKPADGKALNAIVKEVTKVDGTKFKALLGGE